MVTLTGPGRLASYSTPAVCQAHVFALTGQSIRLSLPPRTAILPSGPALGGTMTPSPSPFDSILLTIVLATLAVGLPIFFVLAIRLLWDRKLQLGRSKELEKLIWQLHRVASAMEHQMNLSFPAVQPGTEEATDLVYLQQQAPSPAASARTVAAPNAPAPAPATTTRSVAAPPAPAAVRPANVQPTVAQPPAVPQPATPPPAPQQASAPAPQPAPETPAPAETQEPDFPPLVVRKPTDEPPRHAGVNSMFGF